MLKVMDCKNILKLRSDDGAPEELAVHCKDGSGSRDLTGWLWTGLIERIS
jgi:hypothetical protein